MGREQKETRWWGYWARLGMLPNAEEGVDESRSPGLRLARAQNQLWSWGVCAYNGSH